MRTRSLYISAQDKNVGTLFISMGIMDTLKRNIRRVAFFRPVILSKNVRDKDIDFILKKYKLEMEYEDAYGCDVEYVEKLIAANAQGELLSMLIDKFDRLRANYDFVLCQGLRRAFLPEALEYDLNLLIAQNFASSIINVIGAKNMDAEDIYENVSIELQNIRSHECTHFATFINRLEDDAYARLKTRLKGVDADIYMLKEVKELDTPTVADVAEAFDTSLLNPEHGGDTKALKRFNIVTGTVENFLQEMKEDDLVVVDAARSDIILATITAYYSKEYPKIGAILFTSKSLPDLHIQKMLLGLKEFTLPMLSAKTPTYETAKKLLGVYSKLRVESERKIALALGLFYSGVDVKALEAKIALPKSEAVTPAMFEHKLFEAARGDKKRIVLPESSDERILRAAEIILRQDAAEIILLGSEDEIKEKTHRLGLNLEKALVIDHTTSPLLEKFADEFYEMRKTKGLTRQGAEDAMIHVNYFGVMMVHKNYADAMVSGAAHTTADTVRPALQIIKAKEGVEIVSSLFFMCLKSRVVVFGDCALNQNPNAKELAQIALSCAKTAEDFDIVPKVAMLSYSSGESSSGADVEKVKEAAKIASTLNPQLLLEGPIQYDAAIDKKIASLKLPNSKVAGEASVFIFPDLDSGNNTYKALERSGAAVAVGPILQGLKKPINDLSRGSSVADIVNTILITAIQAQEQK